MDEEAIKEYLKNHLSIQIGTYWSCDGEGKKLEVRLVIDGEKISSDYIPVPEDFD